MKVGYLEEHDRCKVRKAESLWGKGVDANYGRNTELAMNCFHTAMRLFYEVLDDVLESMAEKQAPCKHNRKQVCKQVCKQSHKHLSKQKTRSLLK